MDKTRAVNQTILALVSTFALSSIFCIIGKFGIENLSVEMLCTGPNMEKVFRMIFNYYIFFILFANFGQSVLSGILKSLNR